MAAEGLLVKPRRGRYQLPEQNASNKSSDDTSGTTSLGRPGRPPVDLSDGDDISAMPPGARPLVALYDTRGRRFGTRYVSDAVDFIPYAVVVHPDGTETPYEEATSPEDA